MWAELGLPKACIWLLGRGLLPLLLWNQGGSLYHNSDGSLSVVLFFIFKVSSYLFKFTVHRLGFLQIKEKRQD